MQTITSKDNPLIKKFVAVTENRKKREQTGTFTVEGLRLCKEAAESKIEIKTVFFSQDFLKKHSDEVRFFSEKCCEVVYVTDAVAERLSATVNPQGIFCLCRIPRKNDCVSAGRYILLENLQDPGNIGTIIRSAEAFGMSGVIFAGCCADIYSPKVLRSTMGTAFRIPVYFFDGVKEAAAELKRSKNKLFGAVLDDKALKLSETEFGKQFAVMIGNEANGLSDEAKKTCDAFVFIEMSGKAESLNAAVAASIIMWKTQN